MRKISLIILSLFFLFGAGCNYVDTDLNIDPNNPSSASPDLLLPAAELQIAYTMGGDYGRHTSVWTQHHAGIDRQQAGFDKYLIGESDMDNAWTTIYAGAMQNLRIIIEQTNDASPHYAGVARVLMAYSLGATTDLFGNIPYSEALKGSGGNFTPAFDSQESVYASIITLLDEAIANFDAESALTPGDDDLIYGGDTDLWGKAAKTLKARYQLHKSALGSTAAYTAALEALNGSFADNADNMQFAFLGGSQANPWNQFLTQRQGDLAMGGFFIDLLKETNDPRLEVLATTNDAGEYMGSAAGQQLSAAETSDPADALTGASAPVMLITYAEAKFIEAEAALGTGNTARAQSAFEAAVAASLGQFGITDADFVTAATTELTMENILTQKYIALYTQTEGYVDYRRTGYPALPLAIDAAGPNIPVRFPYPQTERQLNSANCPNVNVFADKLWWDAN